ncbi:Uncharacterized protein APZ42_001924 [Daphnia magna]|uniref:Uncharacterized protein n=1 Tax=Daphnia magna TaxID=35525 RepID=A0A164IMW1_9CRUS|nr:Uncharacterized protein APZ42_001924 [Daphnia magna]
MSTINTFDRNAMKLQDSFPFNMLIFNRDLNPRSLDPYVNVLPQSYNTYKKFIQCKITYYSWLNG